MTAPTPYKPRADSIADRAIDHLRSLPDGTEVMTTALAQAIMCEPLTLPPCLDAPIKHGLIFRRQKDDHPRSPWWYCAIDKSATPRVKRVMVEGPMPLDDVPQFLPTANSQALVSQQVLKAEAPAPDATDRENPATTSPVGGPMGAGQPAAAGHAVELRIALWSDGRLDIVRGAGEFDERITFPPPEARQILDYIVAMSPKPLRAGVEV